MRQSAMTRTERYCFKKRGLPMLTKLFRRLGWGEGPSHRHLSTSWPIALCKYCPDGKCSRPAVRMTPTPMCQSHRRRWLAGKPLDTPIRGYQRYEESPDGVPVPALVRRFAAASRSRRSWRCWPNSVSVSRTGTSESVGNVADRP